MEGSQINASLQQSCCTAQLTVADWKVSALRPHVFHFGKDKNVSKDDKLLPDDL